MWDGTCYTIALSQTSLECYYDTIITLCVVAFGFLGEYLV